MLMSMAEIAELADVRRPVVTTWRRRHQDFPSPAGGDTARPLFDARLVADWLLRTGRGSAEQVGTELSMHTLGSWALDLPARELIALVTALVCLRHLDDNEPLVSGAGDVIGALAARAARIDPQDSYLATEVLGLRRGIEELPAYVDDLVEAAWGCAGAFERVMRERNRFNAADLLVDAVAPSLARLIAEICGARELARVDHSLVIADLSAGAGDLLVAVAGMLGPDYSPVFTGAEQDDYLARLARRRLLVHGIPVADLDIKSDGTAPGGSGDPDVIVTRVPYVPGEGRSAADVLAILDDVSLRLAPDRTAVVLGPADVLVAALPAYSPAERDRARLIASGMVEAIIWLPGGLLPFRPGYQLALWVMSSSFSSPWAGRILIADVSDRPLTEDVAADLAQDVITWRRRGYHPQAHARRFSTQELISDLVDTPGPLASRRPLGITSRTTTAAIRVGRIATIQAELTRPAARASPDRRIVDWQIAAGAVRSPERARIGALTRRGLLAVIKGARISDDDLGAAGHHVVLRPADVLGRRETAALMIDRAVLAERYPGARLTEAGDVIVTSSPALGAIVDAAGFRVVSFPARSLRITAAGRAHFTPRVLAALINASQAGHRPAGAVRAAYRLDELPLPLLSGDDLRRLDALLASLTERAERAQEEIDLLTELQKIAAAGLADGTLTFTGEPI